jgi:hypothetical protein
MEQGSQEQRKEVSFFCFQPCAFAPLDARPGSRLEMGFLLTH